MLSQSASCSTACADSEQDERVVGEPKLDNSQRYRMFKGFAYPLPRMLGEIVVSTASLPDEADKASLQAQKRRLVASLQEPTSKIGAGHRSLTG